MSTIIPVAIACGGTGGHLFPGIAVGQALQARDCEVALLISPKEVDQQSARSASGMEIVTLPAVALQGNPIGFGIGCWKSYRQARQFFTRFKPQMVLAMGGFTSAPPILAGRSFGAKTFLHESNAIPGRANRWLAPFVDQVFVGFAEASARCRCPSVLITGTPVREQFFGVDPLSARMALGLDPHRPVLLIMGGSQGASQINNIALRALPLLTESMPDLQFLHLTGSGDLARVREAYAQRKQKAAIMPFLTEMELALSAATAILGRAGASSLAEIAATGVPALLIPLPTAADNHQFHNAKAFTRAGVAEMLAQSEATPERLFSAVRNLIEDQNKREEMIAALAALAASGVADRIAEEILKTAGYSKRIEAAVPLHARE